MNKYVFLTELSKKLKRLPAEERNAALAYYGEYFDEAGPENEQKVIAELGSPAAVAAGIISEFAYKSTEPGDKKGGGLHVLWIVLLGVFASPVAIPIAAAVFVILLAVIIALFSVLISFAATAVGLALSGLAVAVAAFTQLPGDPSTTLFFIGTGLLCAGIGVAIGVGTFQLSRLCVKGLVKLTAKIVRKGRRVSS